MRGRNNEGRGVIPASVTSPMLDPVAVCCFDRITLRQCSMFVQHLLRHKSASESSVWEQHTRRPNVTLKSRRYARILLPPRNKHDRISQTKQLPHPRHGPNCVLALHIVIVVRSYRNEGNYRSQCTQTEACILQIPSPLRSGARASF